MYTGYKKVQGVNIYVILYTFASRMCVFWFCMWWTDRTACFFHTLPVALTGAAQLRSEGISSCYDIVNVHNQHNHPSLTMSRKEGMAGCSSRPMSPLWWHLQKCLLFYKHSSSKTLVKLSLRRSLIYTDNGLPPSPSILLAVVLYKSI